MVKREFKVGDKVRIKSREELEDSRDEDRMTLTSNMFELAGMVTEVVKVNGEYYRLSADKGWYNWLAEWFEPIGGVYIRSVADRGEDIKKMLTEMGGTLSETMSFNHSNALYFIAPSGRISVVADSVPMGEVIKAEYTELHLPEEKVQQKAEEKKLFVLVHDNRCMRRLVNSPEEVGRYAKWI